VRNGLLGALGTVAVALTCCSTALGAASNPHVTRGAGNEIVLTFTESTTTYGLVWSLDGTAYSVTAANPNGTCLPRTDLVGIGCTWFRGPSGTVSVSMTTDKYVSPNTQTHLKVSSDGAEDQLFDVLVEGGGIAQPPPPPPPPPPTVDDPKKQEKKDAARADLEAAVANAMANCSVAFAGSGLIGAGALSGPNIAAGLSSTVAGAFMVDTAGPLCGLALARVKLDYDLYNDPPDANFGKVALPAKVKARKPLSCRKAGRRGKRACTRLAKAAAALAGAADRAQAIRKAMDVTMNRTSGAVAADNADGLALQDASHRVLAGMLARAIADQNKAAKAFTKLLRGYGIHVKLKGKQAEKGVQRTVAKLVAQGVPQAQLQQLAGNQLAVKSIDVVKSLSDSTPTSALTALAHGLTAPAATTYLNAAATTMHTTAAKARKRLAGAGAYLPR
jgi:hypothetical protein